jgi:hypothetical protein
MSDFEAAREYFEPLFEVYIGRTNDRSERLYIGEIIPDAVTGRHGEIKRRIPVQPCEATALIEWIKSCPDELNRAMEADLTTALGDTVDVLEWYPPIEEVER